MAARQSILVFDSGLGGLTVYREIAARGRTPIFFMSPTTPAFPYGALAEPALVARVVDLMGELIETHQPDLVVIACNTASHHRAAGFAQEFHGAVCRHRAGDQAGLRVVGHAARLRARHRGDGHSANIPARSFAIMRRIAK